MIKLYNKDKESILVPDDAAQRMIDRGWALTLPVKRIEKKPISTRSKGSNE